MAIRAPLDFTSPLTGGTPDIRAPLIFTTPLTGGIPNVRVPEIFAEPLTGGTPNERVTLILAEPLTGGNPNIRCALILVQALIPVPEPLPVATYVFPPLRGGLKWDRAKNPSYNNARRVVTSGRRSVTPFMLYPRWNFTLSYEVLPDERYISSFNTTVEPLKGIVDLYKNTVGGAYTFLYQDPDDYHVVSVPISTGDGVTLQWPFFAEVMGTVLEPAGQLDLSTIASFLPGAVNTGADTITIPGHGLTAGIVPMFVSNSGGGLPAPLAVLAPYWPIVVDVNTIQLATSRQLANLGTAINLTTQGTGVHTLAKGFAVYLSVIETAMVPGTGPYTITLTHNAVFRAPIVMDGAVTLTQVPVSPAAGQFSLSSDGLTYTFNAAQAGDTVTINHGYLADPTTVSLTLPNQLVFTSAPASMTAIYADFDYYFVCRFDDDKMELNEFSKQLYDLQKLNFSSEVG